MNVASATYGIEVELTVAQQTSATTYCDHYVEAPFTRYGGAYLMPNWGVSSGTLRTIVRAPSGEIVRESARDVGAFGASGTIDHADYCTADSKIKVFAPVLDYAYQLLAWVPGVDADVAGGPI